jgi:hypothetical protein
MTDAFDSKIVSSSESLTLDLLVELGRATTAYHDAPPDCLEAARLEYEQALRKFKGSA